VCTIRIVVTHIPMSVVIGRCTRILSCGLLLGKPEAQVMHQLSTSSYHLHIWYETAIMHKRERPIYMKEKGCIIIG
jgi:hypothetical protein